nr:MAG TPA: hypothetical protein [Caudoviricetes sp.]
MFLRFFDILYSLNFINPFCNPGLFANLSRGEPKTLQRITCDNTKNCEIIAGGR